MTLRKKLVTHANTAAETGRQMGMGRSLPNRKVAIDEMGRVYIVLVTSTH